MANHEKEMGDVAIAFANLMHSLIRDINAIKEPKHQVERKQELDKADHYFRKMALLITELNDWLTAFGEEGNDHADENS